MKFDTILFAEPEPGIGLLTLNRPDRLNAMSLEMLDELYALCDHLKRHWEIRVLVVTGAGRGFCSGADLVGSGESTELSEAWLNSANHLEGIQKRYAGIITEMRRLPQPIITAVNGVAAGGGFTMVLASDVIYAGPGAKFVPSFINIGLSGGELGTTYFLPRMVGSARAAEILMTGRTVYAEEAERIGLACRLVGEDKLIDTAMDTAREMIDKGEIALRLTKEAFTQNLNAPSLESAIELENRNQSILCFTQKFTEEVIKFAGKAKEKT